MDLVVSLEQRFSRLPDGSVWSPGVFARPFWERYLDVFDRVRVIARVAEASEAPPGWERSDGENVSFARIPCYVGPWQYCRKSLAVRKAVRAAASGSGAVLMRVGSQVAALLESCLRGADRPFGLEVVGDPHDTFSPGAMRNPLRPVFRSWFTRQLRRQCRRACSVAYVTRDALQRRYPPADGVFQTYYSSIELNSDAFVSSPRGPVAGPRPIRLITVGTLEQLYKAPDVLLDAVALAVRGGSPLSLRIVGDGRRREELNARAARLGITDNVMFMGHLSGGQAVREQLDQADLFVLPSRQEGLPRAMIEAMARALPCIGSTVGGIPELLSPEDLVPPGDAPALAGKIVEATADPDRLARMSARNLLRAGEYHQDILAARRRAHYQYLRERTESWLRERRTR